MPIDSKECFAALTEDGQLWEIYQAAQSGGGGAPTNASYVVMSNDPTLTDERVLTQGTNITITDGGANNPVTVATVADPVFDLVEFDSTYTGGVSQYQMAWNDTDGTVEIGLKGGNVDLSIGQEEVVLAKNDDTIALNPGTAVYVSGADGTNILVKRAKADADATSVTTIGLVAETLTHPNGKGFITTFGVIKNINTTGSPYGETWAAGDVIYLSPTTSGGLTNIKPSAPQHLVQIGFVVKTSAGNGEIFVEVQNGYELEELHNVQINSGTLANNDLLAYNLATQTWQNKTVASAGGITSVAGTSPISASTVSGAVTVTTSMNTARLLGRTTAGVGVAEEISVGTGLSLSGGTLSSTVTAGVTSVTGTSPIASSGGTTPAISIADAAADGTTKGAAAFNANDFNSASGVISLDYTNGQSASASNKGFLTSADWTTFNNKTGGSVGAVDNAVLRADVGTGIVQNSNIVIDDVATATQDNVAIVNASSATNSSLVLTPKGTGAFILGPKPDGTATGGNARGAQAIDLQTKRAAATQVASGLNSVTLGVNCTATSAGNTSPATYSVAIGISSQATGNQSMALGQSCIASGTQSYALGEQNQATSTGSSSIGGSGNVAQIASYAAVFGGQSNNSYGANCGIFSGSSNQASASHAAVFSGASSHSSNTHSISFGPNVLSDRRNMFAHGGGQFSAQGDAQRARFVLRCKTTTNAAVEMALDGGTTYLTIPSGKVMFMNIKVVGSKSDGTAVATYERQYAVKNVAGTSSEIYAAVIIGTDNAAGTSLAVATVDAGDYVSIKPTGITSETWRWVASVDAVEVAYGT